MEGVTVKPDHVMHMSCRPVPVLARVDEEDLAAYTGEAAQGTEPCRAATYYDSIEVCTGGAVIGPRDSETVDSNGKCREDEGDGGAHGYDWLG